jgi:hypothetical protein
MEIEFVVFEIGAFLFHYGLGPAEPASWAGKSGANWLGLEPGFAWDSAQRDSAPRDSAQWISPTRDSAQRHSTQRDSTQQESAQYVCTTITNCANVNSICEFSEKVQ